MSYFYKNTKNNLGFFLEKLTILILACSIVGCSAQTQLVRPAPKEGISVKGLNVLYVAVPLQKRGSKEPGHVPHTAVRDDIGEEVLQQLRKSGITAKFGSIDLTPGVVNPSLKELFPDSYADMHLLTITPVSAEIICYNGSCTTHFTISLSLKAPTSNKELWNVRLQQSPFAAENWFSHRFQPLANDIAKSILTVVKSQPVTTMASSQPIIEQPIPSSEKSNAYDQPLIKLDIHSLKNPAKPNLSEINLLIVSSLMSKLQRTCITEVNGLSGLKKPDNATQNDAGSFIMNIRPESTNAIDSIHVSMHPASGSVGNKNLWNANIPFATENSATNIETARKIAATIFDLMLKDKLIETSCN